MKIQDIKRDGNGIEIKVGKHLIPFSLTNLTKENLIQKIKERLEKLDNFDDNKLNELKELIDAEIK